MQQQMRWREAFREGGGKPGEDDVCDWLPVSDQMPLGGRA